MNYATQDIIEALKAAREARGLSQRGLSQRTGVPQSHISKIENGGTDIRLSSLIELARALDLDLKLVPRKAVPAVDSVVRSTAPKVVTVTPTALKEINRTLDTIKRLHTIYPELEQLNRFQKSLQTIKPFAINIHRELATLREITKPVHELQRIAEQSKQITDAIKLPSAQIKALEEATKSAQALRNELIHKIPGQTELPRPAYRLDEDEEKSDG